jgi:hypothetical protein
MPQQEIITGNTLIATTAVTSPHGTGNALWLADNGQITRRKHIVQYVFSGIAVIIAGIVRQI